MFTGIIEEVGIVEGIEEKNALTTFTVKAEILAKDTKIGASIAINGACMTVTTIKDGRITFDTIQESLDKTNLKDLKEGAEVNLESALRFGEKLEGHLLQGHVDGEGIVHEKNEQNILTIKFPKGMEKYLALKGSIAINGVSLTISHLEAGTFSVALIPHTLEKTNLKNLTKEDKVNLEIDVLARYLESLLDAKENETKYHFLQERNLI